MSGQAVTLLLALQAVGVHVALGAAGDTLELTGKMPPAVLLDEVKANKVALLEALGQKQTEVLLLESHLGHCGSCARWTPSLSTAHMGECSAGRQAHGWLDGALLKPVEIQSGHRCIVQNGKAWRARVAHTLSKPARPT